MKNFFQKNGLELWGGLEATIVRINDEYRDQLEMAGHYERPEDLELFKELGIKKIRYPVLWEKASEPGFWKNIEERLNRLRELGITPIIGLIHHGSGPKNTSLIDDNFPSGLAEFASQVANRFPWVEYYTPVNEPLTTARFSCLYGHWYPHKKDRLLFTKALLNECKATVLAMEAIKKINPKAKLVQTEDLGKTYATSEMQYQADFENERRWVTWDLLCGQLTPDKRLWGHFIWSGIKEKDLQWFLEHKYPPDIIGINYYLTSERFLDQQVEKYADVPAGGNGQHKYVDVEAVRVLREGIGGHKQMLEETWERFKIPIAITEVHLDCTREEQMRWFLEAWTSSEKARLKGIDVRAVTAWALLGSFDWNSLLTKNAGHYEPGIFDIRGGKRRPTAVAGVIKNLSNVSSRGASAAERRGDLTQRNKKIASSDALLAMTQKHPILQIPGWWQRPDRLLYPKPTENELSLSRLRYQNVQPILIVGGRGTLGKAFAKACEIRGINYVSSMRGDMDIASEESVWKFISELKPWAVINAAGYVKVDQAETEKELCFRENVTGPVLLARVCKEQKIPLAVFSSDLIFDGSKKEAYVESDAPKPLGVYGRSKADMEKSLLGIYPQTLIARTSSFFGIWDEYNFLTVTLSKLAQGETVEAMSDAIVSPTYVRHLVDAVLDLLLDGVSGIWHVVNKGEITWYDFAKKAAEMAGIPSINLKPVSLSQTSLAAPRPQFSALATEKGFTLPSLKKALSDYILHMKNNKRLPILEKSKKVAPHRT